uniref:Uncharacterized protein n=1 Tax=Cacopsylla melanoneura TaxID=428564 RepID=A0A8D9EAW7_9HEMI
MVQIRRQRRLYIFFMLHQDNYDCVSESELLFLLSGLEELPGLCRIITGGHLTSTIHYKVLCLTSTIHYSVACLTSTIHALLTGGHLTSTLHYSVAYYSGGIC